MSLIARGPVDTVMALAIIHHLAISNNLPFDKIFQLFNRICRKSLIIEFIPKQDSKVQELLLNREDIFPEYTQQNFEKTFGRYFFIEAIRPLAGSQRVVYFLKRRQE